MPAFSQARLNFRRPTSNDSLLLILIEGIYSHFSTAEEKDTEYRDLQLKRFKEVVIRIKKNKVISLELAMRPGSVLGLQNQ